MVLKMVATLLGTVLFTVNDFELTFIGVYLMMACVFAVLCLILKKYGRWDVRLNKMF